MSNTKKYMREYYELNKKRIKRMNKAYYKEKYALDAKYRKKKQKYFEAYHALNKDKINKKHRQYYNKMYGKNIQFTLKKTVCARIRMALKSQGATRAYSYNVLIGCSFPTLQKYIGKKFRPGMKWKDHTMYGFHIDHIRPVSSFDLNKKSQQLKAFNYLNTQPLPAAENYKKAGKYLEKLEEQNKKLRQKLREVRL